MKKIMKKALSLTLVLALAIVPMTVMAADGDSSSPISVTNGGSVAVASGAKVYCTSQVLGAAMMGGVCDVTVTGNTGFTVYGIPSEMAIGRGENAVTDTNGTAVVSSFTGGMMSSYSGSTLFAIENTSASEQTYTIKAELPKGTMDNPEVIEFQFNQWSGAYGAYVSKELAEGSQGYYYTCTAPADGAISVQVNAFDPTYTTYDPFGWTYSVNNVTAGKYGDTHWSDDAEVVNPEMVPVSTGDVLVIMVNTYDPNNAWVSPAAAVGVNLGFYSLGDAEYPDTAVLGENTANVKASSWGYNYTYTATEAGIIKVTIDESSVGGWQYNVNNLTSSTYGDFHTSEDDPVVTSEEVAVAAGDELQIVINTFDPENSWNAPAGTVKWTLSFEAGSTGGQGGSGEQGGSDNQGGSDEVNYFESETALVVGDNALNVSNQYTYSVYKFEPTATGKYTISTEDSKIGLVGYNWVNGNPTSDVVKETSIELNCTGVGQEFRIAVLADTNVANIKVQKTGEAELNTTDWTIYKNKKTPTTFKYDGDVNKLLETKVVVNDSVVDKAVLGKDGYYHLNSADGELLYVNLNDARMSLATIIKTGKLSAVFYDENDKVKEAIDFTSALLEYLGVKDITELEALNLGTNPVIYPLTEDLMTMFQKVGEANTWYGENGAVSGATGEDAWMYACYYVKGDSTLNGTMSTSPNTGDTANVTVWAIVMVVAAGAAFVVAESKKRAR